MQFRSKTAAGTNDLNIETFSLPNDLMFLMLSSLLLRRRSYAKMLSVSLCPCHYHMSMVTAR